MYKKYRETKAAKLFKLEKSTIQIKEKQKPEWSFEMQDPNRFKLTQSELLQKKLSLKSKHQIDAKEEWLKRQEKLKNGIKDQETDKIMQTALESKNLIGTKAKYLKQSEKTIHFDSNLNETNKNSLNFSKLKQKPIISNKENVNNLNLMDKIEKNIENTREFIKTMEKCKNPEKLFEKIENNKNENKININENTRKDDINSYFTSLNKIEETINFLEKNFNESTINLNENESKENSPIPNKYNDIQEKENSYKSLKYSENKTTSFHLTPDKKTTERLINEIDSFEKSQEIEIKRILFNEKPENNIKNINFYEDDLYSSINEKDNKNQSKTVIFSEVEGKDLKLHQNFEEDENEMINRIKEMLENTKKDISKLNQVNFEFPNTTFLGKKNEKNILFEDLTKKIPKNENVKMMDIFQKSKPFLQNIKINKKNDDIDNEMSPRDYNIKKEDKNNEKKLMITINKKFADQKNTLNINNFLN